MTNEIHLTFILLDAISYITYHLLFFIVPLCQNLYELHRRDKTDFPHVSKHFNSCCKVKSYSIQIIEVLCGNRHNETGIVDENNYRLRLGSEDFWKTLRTNFSYGLNERSKYLIPGEPIGTKFYPIGRSDERNNRCHKNQNCQHSKVSLRNFRNFLRIKWPVKAKMLSSKFIKYQKHVKRRF